MYFKTQATPLPLLTRTATVRANPGGRPRISLGRGCVALVLGLDARRARRQVREAMLHCAGPGRGWTEHGEDGDSGAGAGRGHVVMVTKSLRSASLTISFSCSHLRPKAMRVSVGNTFTFLGVISSPRPILGRWSREQDRPQSGRLWKGPTG